MKSLLILEDSDECFAIVERILSSEFHVLRADCLKTAREILEKQTPDIIILDVILPDGNGFDFFSYLKNIKALSDIPILFLTGKTNTSDKVLGFTLGAEDYICKPFEPIELKLRVMARLKRKIAEDILLSNGIKLDLRNHSALMVVNGDWKELSLTNTEFKILLLFLKHPNELFSREKILNTVWGENIYLFPRIVDTYISKLRKKIQETEVQIKSINRRGYKIISVAQ